MRILIGQNHLDTLGGSETFTYALIEEFHQRGHDVDVLCAVNRKGIMSNLIEENFGIKTNVLHRRYDACFVSHNSMVSFFFSKGLFTDNFYQICHGTVPPLEQPSNLPDVKLISISKEVQAHLLKKSFQSEVITNGINLERFKPTKINKELKNIFSLSQSERLNIFLEKVCKKYGFNFKRNNKFRNPIFNIEEEIKWADLVVSLGRGVYESMACGKNVLIADYREYQPAMMDGFITEQNINRFMQNNCSGRTEKREVDEKSILEELDKYSVDSGEFNRSFAENNLNIVEKVDTILSLVEKTQT